MRSCKYSGRVVSASLLVVPEEDEAPSNEKRTFFGVCGVFGGESGSEGELPEGGRSSVGGVLPSGLLSSVSTSFSVTGLVGVPLTLLEPGGMAGGSTDPDGAILGCGSTMLLVSGLADCDAAGGGSVEGVVGEGLLDGILTAADGVT